MQAAPPAPGASQAGRAAAFRCYDQGRDVGGNAEEGGGGGSGEFSAMVGAMPTRVSTGGLAEVSIDGGGAGEAQGTDAATKPKPGGRMPTIQLSVDSRAARAGGSGSAVGALAAAAAGPAGPRSTGGAAGVVAAAPAAGVSGSGRQESAGLEYAADSKAVMARVNRWWKNFDEKHMQPHFGGPSRSGAGGGAGHAAAAGAGPAAAAGSSGGVQASGPSCTVPVSRPGG